MFLLVEVFEEIVVVVDKGEIRIWFGGSWNLVLNKSGTWEME